MYDIEMHEMSRDFFRCWQAAGMHLNDQVRGGIQSWLRAHPYPPFLEHLSFRFKNQLFFVRVEDVEGKIEGPGNSRGFIDAANNANGHACILPMKRNQFADSWAAARSGWGLIDPERRTPVNPPELVTSEKIEMSAWEVHDLAVQVVRDHLKASGFQLMSWQSKPEVNPSIWFIGKSLKPEWVVVRSATFPERKADRPKDWKSIAAGCANLSPRGHFASVAVASPFQSVDINSHDPVPLWRGLPIDVHFGGLE